MRKRKEMESKWLRTDIQSLQLRSWLVCTDWCSRYGFEYQVGTLKDLLSKHCKAPRRVGDDGIPKTWAQGWGEAAVHRAPLI